MTQKEDRARKLTVLAALAIGMTIASGLLLLLEPPTHPPLSGGGVMLRQIDPAATLAERRNDAEMLFDERMTRPWRSIVIRDAGSAEATAQSLHRQHLEEGRGGLGFHFVINPAGDGDKLIEVGYRWQRQDLYDAAVFNGDGADDFNHNAITICLIGDLDARAPTQRQLEQLIRLTQRLQQRYAIPPGEVFLQLGRHGEAEATSFPVQAFKDHLLSDRAEGPLESRRASS